MNTSLVFAKLAYITSYHRDMIFNLLCSKFSYFTLMLEKRTDLFAMSIVYAQTVCPKKRYSTLNGCNSKSNRFRKIWKVKICSLGFFPSLHQKSDRSI